MSKVLNPYLSNLECVLNVCLKLLEGATATLEEARIQLKKNIILYEQALESIGVSADCLFYAKYALIAYIDETLMCEGPYEGKWQLSALAWEVFKDQCAGEGFFHHLEEMLNKNSQYAEVIDLYYYLLCLGFKGRYSLFDPHQWQIYMLELETKLHNHSIAKRTQLPLLLSKKNSEEFKHKRKPNQKQYLILLGIVTATILVFVQSISFYEDYGATELSKKDEMLSAQLSSPGTRENILE